MDTINITDIATIRINPATDPAVIEFAERARKLQSFAEIRQVLTDDDVRYATDDLSLLAGLKKNIEATRKEYVGPINDHLKAVNAAFKTITDPLDAADKNNRDKILVYKLEQRVKAEQAEEINRLRMEAARKEMELKGELTESVSLVEPVSVLPKTVTSDMGASSTVKTRKWEVEDISKVPAQYLKVDDVTIGKLVRAGIPEIPGIRIYVEESLRINAR